MELVVASCSGSGLLEHWCHYLLLAGSADSALAVRSLTAALLSGRPSLTRLEPPVRQLRLFRGQPR